MKKKNLPTYSQKLGEFDDWNYSFDANFSTRSIQETQIKKINVPRKTNKSKNFKKKKKKKKYPRVKKLATKYNHFPVLGIKDDMHIIFANLCKYIFLVKKKKRDLNRFHCRRKLIFFLIRAKFAYDASFFSQEE